MAAMPIASPYILMGLLKEKWLVCTLHAYTLGR
jgi:hypothetical protein